MSSGVVGTREKRLRVSTIGRLPNDFEQASEYHEAERELAAEANGRARSILLTRKRSTWRFTRSGRNYEAAREGCLELARGESHVLSVTLNHTVKS